MAQGHSPEAGTASERGVAGTSGSPRYAICLCVDRGMIVPAAFVACSVLSHARRPANPFDLIIVTPPGELNDGEKAFLRSRGIVVEESLSLAAVENIEIVQKRLSHATLLRLLLPAHYHGRYDRILYLDADLTIHGDVSTLFSLEMRDFPLAAVGTGRVLSDLKEEHAQKTLDHFAVLGMTPPYGYFNSGVMVMDLQNWLGEQLTEKALAFLRENPEICLLPDEDALNAVLDGRLVELSPIWNIRPERIRASNVDPVIIHFAGPNKPWNRFDRFDKPAEHRRALTQYRVFLRDAPWPGFLDEEGNIKARLERLKFDTARLLPRLKNRLSRETRQRRRRFCEDLGAYNASTPFADVDQGLAVRRGASIFVRPGPS